jgi:large subunit ribosomal protein L15
LGQGIGSGTGKTAGKGNKGHKSRTGGGVRPGFEGGQMPLARRVPKRGFNNARFAQEYQIVNLESLSKKFEGGEMEISATELHRAGLVRSPTQPVKLLAKGTVDRAFTVKVNAASQSAREKIEAAGGKVEVI